MKKIFTFFILLTFITFSLVSCKKENHGTQYETLDVSLARGANYQLDLRQYGDADDIATITKQADDYVTSEISSFVYKYTTATTPKVSSTGHDNVVLKVSEPAGRGRCGGHKSETVISINFTLQ